MGQTLSNEPLVEQLDGSGGEDGVQEGTLLVTTRRSTSLYHASIGGVVVEQGTHPRICPCQFRFVHVCEQAANCVHGVQAKL